MRLKSLRSISIMYSLLVCQATSEKRERAFAIEKHRFLEYTSDSISTQLQTLSTEAIACIQSWPCVLMNEGRGLEKAEIVEIMQVERERANIKITVRSLTQRFVITN